MTPLTIPDQLGAARLAVLQQYGATVAGLNWVPLGTGGGFSGASVWRGDDEGGNPIFALKAWPADGMTADRLTGIHALMTRAGHLAFVPAVIPCPDSRTVIAEGGRVWDLTRWMPGTPAPSENTPANRVAAACATVAELHMAWQDGATRGPCPGVRNRLGMLIEAPGLMKAVTQTQPPHPELIPLLRRAVAAAARLAPGAELALRAWAVWPVTIHPCFRDLRAAHILFTGDAVTGLIDYGAAADDTPATDLARLLGDYAAENDDLFTVGFEAYWAAGGDLGVPEEFVRLLERTGVLCSALGWLRRLYAPRGPEYNLAAVAARLTHLVERMERFPLF